jgi:hypothetical protein
MRYLGGISGQGVLRFDGEKVARASYDFDSFFTKPVGVTFSGEIRLAPAVLKDVFGRKDAQLLTDNGRLFDLRFSEKELLASSDVAHVDVTRELPAQTHRH